MLFSTFVLVSVEGEHDRLEEGVNFGQADETTERSDVARLGLEEEEEVGVLLKFALIGEMTFCRIHLLEVLLNFTLLLMGKMHNKYRPTRDTEKDRYFVESHAILNEESYPLIKVTDVTLQDKVLLGLC